MRRVLPGPGEGGLNRRPAPRWLAAAGLAALWLPPLVRWSRAWSDQPGQGYGWAVPLLAGCLAWERWRERPAAAAGSGRRAAWAAAAVAGFALLAASLPVLEANVLWPTAQWAAWAGACLATLALLGLAGGTAWARHFVFPAAFMTTALTWPTAVHLWVVRVLAGGNAALAAEIVSALGHPAVVNGNVIAVSTGMVGVAEACSGERSLQAIWMAAWFLGEGFRLNRPRRAVLVGASLAAAIAANLARTTFLTWEAAARGVAASGRWHDRAAAAELIAALAATLLLARRAARPRERPRAARPPRAAGDRPAPPWPLGWTAAALAAGVFCEGVTQAWYLAHEWRAQEAGIHWTLAAPDDSWRPVEVPDRARAVLQYTRASGLRWSDPVAAERGWAFVVSWEGDAAQGENPEWHDPTICLPGSGVERTADLGAFRLRIGGVPVTFTGYRFAAGGRPLEVFFCHWDAALAEARREGDDVDLRLRRLERVRDGRRRGDVAHITLEVEGADGASAAAWLRRWAPLLLQPSRS